MIEIIPQMNDLEWFAAFAEEHQCGFEYNDFMYPDFMDDKHAVQERIHNYKTLGRDISRDTMHGAFFDVIHFSNDRKIREVAFSRMCESMDVAAELGCRGVVFHTNIVPDFLNSSEYRDKWYYYSENCIYSLLEKYENTEVYFENSADPNPQLLSTLGKKMQGVDRFGICLDLAHMMLQQEKPEVWFQALAPYIKHFHMNDNLLKYDNHLAMGDGSIPWDSLKTYMEQYDFSHCNTLLEVKGKEKTIKSFQYYQKLF